VLGLPLSGFQAWDFGRVNPDGSTRDMLVPASGSHFNCASTVFSGQNVKICARLDPTAPSFGKVDCKGTQIVGYNSQVQIDHNTNQNNPGLPQDAGCVNTFTNADGSVGLPCVEGVGASTGLKAILPPLTPTPKCGNSLDPTPGPHTHFGVCNSPTEQTFSGNYPPNGFNLTEVIDLSFEIGSDCSGPQPCPPDGSALQDGELQIAGQITSGAGKGIIWQVNNTSLIMGTTGPGSGATICGTASDSLGGNNCGTTAAGGPLPPPPSLANCASIASVSGCTGLGTPWGCCTDGLSGGHGTCNSLPSVLTGAAVALTYPAIDIDPTIGEFIATLQLNCN
jgi:hypothetical protein